MYHCQSNQQISTGAKKAPQRVRVGVPYGNGTNLSPMSQPLSSAQNAAYSTELESIPRVHGGAVGCSYTGWSDGIKCQYSNGMPSYAPNVASYASMWGANVTQGFPAPIVSAPGGYEQIMMGGGSGSPACAQDCSCQGDASCPCRRANNLNCGYASVNQACVEPIPGGMYPSLAACENANARGDYNPLNYR
jgi:hypothetical protein